MRKLVLLLVFALTFFKGQSETAIPTIKDPEVYLNQTLAQLNASLYQLIQITKQVSHKAELATIIEKYQIEDISCTLFEEINPNIVFEDYMLLSAVIFEKIDEEGDYIRLHYEDINIWVHRNCLYKLSEEYRPPQTQSLNTRQYQWLDLASEIYAKKKIKIKALEKQYKKWKISDQDTINSSISQLIFQIERKSTMIDGVYEKLLQNFESQNVAFQPFQDRISGTARILIGTSSLNQSFENNSPFSLGTGNNDIAFDVRYHVNKESKVGLNFSNRSDTRLTPYNQIRTGANYQLANKLLNFQSNLSFLHYADQVTDSRNYNKVFFNSSISSPRSLGKFNYNANYRFFNQFFTIDQNPNYGKHDVLLNAEYNLNPGFKTLAFINYSRGFSAKPILDFSFINPRIRVQTSNGEIRRTFDLSIERTEFFQAAFQNNNRLVLASENSKKEDEVNKKNKIQIIYRDFINSSSLSYLDLSARKNTFILDQISKNFTGLGRLRVYPQNLDRSFADYRLSREARKKLYVYFDQNFRLGYPGSFSFPINLIGNFKFGIQLKQIRIGPILGYYFDYDFKEDFLLSQFSDTRMRYGLESSGNIASIKNLKVNYRVSYDFNTQYIEQSTFVGTDYETNLIPYNPSNLQLDMDVTYHVMEFADLYLRVDAFNAYSDAITNFVVGIPEISQGFNFKAGVLLRYN